MNAYATDLKFPPVAVDPVTQSGVTSSPLPCTESVRVEISSAFAEKSSTEKMHAIVQLVAQPFIAGEGKARRIERAARHLGLSYRRARGHWYAEAKQVNADELDHARHTAQAIAATLYRRLAALEEIDADFYRPEIDATRQLLDRAGFVAGPGTETGGEG